MITLNVIFGGEVYQEEANIRAGEFFEKVKNRELPTTSQPPIGEFIELFVQLSNDYDAVISIHLSSGISSTFQGAVAATIIVSWLKV
jgi:DegV family protein with EDD domain